MYKPYELIDILYVFSCSVTPNFCTRRNNWVTKSMNKQSRTALSLTQLAMLNMTGPLGYQGILLTQIQLTVSHNMQIPLGRTALQPPFPSLCRFIVSLSQVMNPALAFVELHAACDCPNLWYVTIFLQSLPALEGLHSSSKPSAILKLNY